MARVPDFLAEWLPWCERSFKSFKGAVLTINVLFDVDADDKYDASFCVNFRARKSLCQIAS